MKFVRKKNLQENEEILHTPNLHWFFNVKHMVLSLPVFVILLVVWGLADDYAASGWFPGITTGDQLREIIRYTFLAAVLAVLLVFVCRLIQYICVQYGVTNKRLIIKKGVLRIVTVEIPIDRIETVCCIQGLFGMMFNYGTIRVSGIGGSIPIFHMVCRPYALRRKITAIIEKNKTITVVHGELPKLKPPVPVPAEPIYRYGTFVRVLKS